MSTGDARMMRDETGRPLHGRPRSVTRWAALRWLATALMLVACAPNPDLGATTNPTPAPASPRELPTAILPDGTRITLDVAVTPEELARGLMFRPFLPENRGMLLVFDEQRVPSIWMKNTLVHLDLVFLDDSGRVVDVIERVEPCATDPCPHYVPRHPARTVLEIAAGVAGSHALEAGDIVEFQQVDGYPVQPADQTAIAD